jgi:hypothetical protein
MRFNGHFILAIAALFVFQAALCPAICAAGIPQEVPARSESLNTDFEQEHSRAEPPCHQSQRGTRQDIPTDHDTAPIANSCNAAPTVAYAAEKVPDPPSLALVVFLPTMVSTTRWTTPSPHESDHPPSLGRLLLFKNSFLL